jgi:hypothetical protein
MLGWLLDPTLVATRYQALARLHASSRRSNLLLSGCRKIPAFDGKSPAMPLLAVASL